MTEPQPQSAVRPRRGQGFWLTAGEIVGVLALVIAGLNLWDNHQQHLDEARRTQAQTRAATAFVATGDADAGGRTVGLRPLKAGQAIQSQRYVFPSALSDHPVDLTAERPRIDIAWLSAGLKKTLDDAGAPDTGEARAPVAISTVYVEDGDTHADTSLYEVGIAWKRGLFRVRQVRLTGISLTKRGLQGDATAAVNARWATAIRGFGGP